MKSKLVARSLRGAMPALCAGILTLAAAHAADNLTLSTNRGLVEMMTAGGDGASIDMAEDIANVLNDGATRRVLPVVGRGSVQNLVDLRALRGIDIAIVQMDVLDYARKNRSVPGLEGAVSYIAKLHNEELHILARSGVKAVSDLVGKKVEFPEGAGVTGIAVFDLLKVKVEPVFDDHALALQRLRAGEVAALAYVAAKPTSFFDSVSTGEGFHFVPVPLRPELTAAYVPARLTNDDYPRLVGADAGVDTIAVGAVMVVAGLPPNTERWRNVANFVDAFFTQFPRLQEAARHPKWAEVNLAAELPGWRRFAPAENWLKHNLVASAPQLDEKELHEIFAKFLDERIRLSGGKAMSPQEKDKLFEQFRRWQASQAR